MYHFSIYTGISLWKLIFDSAIHGCTQYAYIRGGCHFTFKGL